MPFKIIRNDITKMNTEAIVNTANDHAAVGTGCDSAVYEAAGYQELLEYRKKHIGFVEEGGAFITPGFQLQAKYIIHAVSPYYVDGKHGEEKKLRSCYSKSLQLAKENGVKSIAFPLISTGGFGYPKEEGIRIAADEINTFLLSNEMLIYLVVFDRKATALGEKLYPDLESYIDHNYVESVREKEYGKSSEQSIRLWRERSSSSIDRKPNKNNGMQEKQLKLFLSGVDSQPCGFGEDEASFLDFEGLHEGKLEERMSHLSDTFSEYLMYLIQERKMENAEVWKRAIVDKKIFSKIKNNVNYHPNKLTALCLCVGAKLNLDETRDLLARAGYALSPCDKTDIIFSYFIENEIYDMIELDIQLEEHGLPCIIS